MPKFVSALSARGARLGFAMLSLCAAVAIGESKAAEPAPPANPEVTVPEPEGYWTGPANSPVPETLTDGKVVRLEELTTLLKHGNVVIVDVSNKPKRPEGLAKDAPWLPVPQQVIPGSLWIPGAGMGAIEPAVETVFKKRLNNETASNPTYPIVIYCHERCWLSWNAAKRAVSYGYRNVYWFPDGIEGWKAAGYPTATAEAIEPKRAKAPAPVKKPPQSKPNTTNGPSTPNKSSAPKP